MHESGKMHEHENDADKSTSNSVTVSNLPTQTVTTQSQIAPLNRQKIGGKPQSYLKSTNNLIYEIQN